MRWFQDNGLALIFFLMTTVFGVGVAYANVDARLSTVEKTIAKQQDVLHKMEKTMVRLETVTDRLERVAEND